MKNPSSPILIAISMGDPLGVGPEVILKALCSREVRGRVIPIVVGLPSIIRREARTANIRIPIRTLSWDKVSDASENGVVYVLSPEIAPGSGGALQTRDYPDAGRCRPTLSLPRAIEVLQARGHWNDVEPAFKLAVRGTLASACVDGAVRLCLQGHARALVTAPISKESLKAAGIAHAGHTEMLRDLCGCTSTLMMFVRGRNRISLVTTHVPLSMIRKMLTRSRIERAITLTHKGLKLLFGVSDPRLAVLSLNPHRGEGGLLGGEEKNVIEPAIESASQNNVKVCGPFAADSFFSRGQWKQFDAVVAMYHDQGLIAAKLIGGERVTNLTLGLPFVRTSPGHGVAEDIAGKGIAEPWGMISAILLAAKLAGTVRLPLKWN